MKWTIENIRMLYHDLEIMADTYKLPLVIDSTGIIKYRIERCEITGDETSILFVYIDLFYFWIKIKPYFNKNMEIYSIDLVDSKIESLIDGVTFVYNVNEIINYLKF